MLYGAILKPFQHSISKEIEVFLLKKSTVKNGMEQLSRLSEEMVPLQHQETQH